MYCYWTDFTIISAARIEYLSVLGIHYGHRNKVKRVTILSMSSFQMHISLLLSLGMVTAGLGLGLAVQGQ